MQRRRNRAHVRELDTSRTRDISYEGRVRSALKILREGNDDAEAATRGRARPRTCDEHNRAEHPKEMATEPHPYYLTATVPRRATRRLRKTAATAARATASRVSPSVAPPPELPPEEPPPALVAALAAGVIATCAVPERAASATDTAVIITVVGDGTEAGAVYIPVLETVPTVEFPPATPFTCHVTAMFDVFATVAVNVCEPETATDGFAGLTETVIMGVTVTCAEADLVVSAADTAVTVTAAGDGTEAGAV